MWSLPIFFWVSPRSAAHAIIGCERSTCGSATGRTHETPAAVETAQHIRSHHQTLEMDEVDGSWEHVTGLLLHAGQPFADSSLFAANAVCRLMRQHVTVALSGDGGDEPPAVRTLRATSCYPILATTSRSGRYGCICPPQAA